MTFAGPGIYLEEENLKAIGRGEFLKSVSESPEDWCGAVPPGVDEATPCRYPALHRGRHEWQRLGRR